MSSLFDLHIENVVDDYLRSDGFKGRLSLHIKWMVQDFEPGFGIKERECFTATVAKRIRQKSRRRLCLWGLRLWRIRMPWAFCNAEAERIVTYFLRVDKIKFGDPSFCWEDGYALADEDMSYWEAA